MADKDREIQIWRDPTLLYSSGEIIAVSVEVERPLERQQPRPGLTWWAGSDIRNGKPLHIVFLMPSSCGDGSPLQNPFNIWGYR